MRTPQAPAATLGVRCCAMLSMTRSSRMCSSMAQAGREEGSAAAGFDALGCPGLPSVHASTAGDRGIAPASYAASDATCLPPHPLQRSARRW